MGRQSADLSLLRDPNSTLLQGSPNVGLSPLLAPSSLGGLFKGRVESIDSKTYEFTVRRLDGPSILFPGRLSFSYCNAETASGFIAIPKVGSLVIYQETFQDGDIYANVITYITGNIRDASFTYKKGPLPQNPGFELFGSVFQGDVAGYKDQALTPGDMGLFGENGNKVKVFADKTVLIKCTPYNFSQWSPIDHKFYQWSVHNMNRTPGSYQGDFSIVTSEANAANSLHYAVRRHFINPIEQTLTVQEEIGLVDDLNTAAGGNFEDAPNAEMVQATASAARIKEPSVKPTLNGYNVYKRKIFDFGGRGLAKKPPTEQDEFFCEEFKTDGAYRVHFGMRKPGAPRPTNGVEVYYKPNGEWSIGSKYGKIRVTEDGLVLSTRSHEILLDDLCASILGHVHAASLSTLTGMVLTPIGTTGNFSASFPSGVPSIVTKDSSVNISDPIKVSTGANTTNASAKVGEDNGSYLPVESVEPDENLFWLS